MYLINFTIVIHFCLWLVIDFLGWHNAFLVIRAMLIHIANALFRNTATPWSTQDHHPLRPWRQVHKLILLYILGQLGNEASLLHNLLPKKWWWNGVFQLNFVNYTLNWSRRTWICGEIVYLMLNSPMTTQFIQWKARGHLRWSMA